MNPKTWRARQMVAAPRLIRDDLSRWELAGIVMRGKLRANGNYLPVRQLQTWPKDVLEGLNRDGWWNGEIREVRWRVGVNRVLLWIGVRAYTWKAVICVLLGREEPLEERDGHNGGLYYDFQPWVRYYVYTGYDPQGIGRFRRADPSHDDVDGVAAYGSRSWYVPGEPTEYEWTQVDVGPGWRQNWHYHVYVTGT